MFGLLVAATALYARTRAQYLGCENRAFPTGHVISVLQKSGEQEAFDVGSIGSYDELEYGGA